MKTAKKVAKGLLVTVLIALLALFMFAIFKTCSTSQENANKSEVADSLTETAERDGVSFSISPKWKYSNHLNDDYYGNLQPDSYTTITLYSCTNGESSSLQAFEDAGRSFITSASNYEEVRSFEIGDGTTITYYSARFNDYRYNVALGNNPATNTGFSLLINRGANSSLNDATCDALVDSISFDPLKAVAYKTSASSSSEANDSSSESKQETSKYQAGSYRVGKDIPAGEYKIYATSSGYFCVYPDSSKSEIMENGNFTTCTYVEVLEGQLLEVDDAYFVPIDKATKATSLSGQGIYKVGLDLDAGEYNVIATGTSGGYYSILSSVDASVLDNIVDNDNFDGNSYVTVKEGQYLEISRASIQVSS